MPLMGSLYVGQSALQTSQNSLNTTAHNMSNLDTTGYTRQQILLSDKRYNTLNANASAASIQQVGLGVTYSKTRQVRNFFLDQTYRREVGRSAFYDTSYTTISQVETLLGEMYDATFNDSLEDLKEALDELAKTPGDSVVQGLLVQRSAAFLESAQAVYKGLNDYQDNMNLQARKQVELINQYGKKIKELNGQIVKIESGGIESANDLRDVRNQLLDELGTMVNMSYKEDLTGNVTVRIEGHDFLSRDTLYEIGMKQDEITGFYTPFWIVDADYTVNSQGKKTYNIEGAEVFNLKQKISTEMNTDIGGLKAILLARGDKRANYTDLQDKDSYNRDISQSVIMNVQAEFDQLIHEMATKMNGVFADAADTSTGYLCEEVMVNGQKTYRPIQLFEKKASEGYTYGQYTDAGGNIQKGWLYNAEDKDKSESLYSVMNLTINAGLLKEPTKLGFVKNEKEDFQTAAALLDTFSVENISLNPNVTTKVNFMEYYSDLVSQISNSGSTFYKIANSQQQTVEATDSAREQVIGVSTDEELSNMIRFQNAYNAASRYINVISEMLEHIITNLG